MFHQKRLLVHIGGARGVGKGAVLKYLSQYIKCTMPLAVMSVSTHLFQLSKEYFGRDWGELIDVEKRHTRSVFIEVLKQLPTGITILDSHYVDVMPNGIILPIMPVELHSLIHCHMVIHCDTDTLLCRRARDVSKNRTLNRYFVERERRGELVIGRRIARQEHVPFHLIRNGEDVGCAAKRLGDILKAQWSISLS